MGDSDTRIRVATYNVFMRPPLVHSYRTFLGVPLVHQRPDEKWQRLEKIADVLPQYDIIGLQEMFGSFSSRRDYLLDLCKKKGLHFSYVSSQPSVPSVTSLASYSRVILSTATWQEPKCPLIDGGLAIISRYPLYNQDELVYTHSNGSDCLASKGCLYAVVRHPSSDIHVFVTHLQAGYKQHRDVATSQLSELTAFIRSKTSHSREPVLLLGDFNIDARNMQEKTDMDLFCEGANLCDSLSWKSGDARPSTSLNQDRCSLDYIFYRAERSNMTPVHSEIHSHWSNDGLYFMGALSDHCLVETIFQLHQIKSVSMSKAGLAGAMESVSVSQTNDYRVDSAVDLSVVEGVGDVSNVAPRLNS